MSTLTPDSVIPPGHPIRQGADLPRWSAEYRQVQPISLLIAHRHGRILTADSMLIRELVLDPSRNYQPRHSTQIGHYHLRQTGTMT